MDSYTSLLERTRVPQPSLQRFAVISIFEKIRSAPPHLNADSDAGRDAISKCLYSASSSVVDQSVRELCRLVKDSKFDLYLGLLELQSALEGCDSKFVNVFVKGLGFLVRYGFQKNPSSFRFNSSEAHPFVKVLTCRSKVQTELVQQVLLFISRNKQLGMSKVCEFLRPFLNFSVLRIPFSASLCMFAEDLTRSMASACCSFPREAMPLIMLLVGCLKYLPVKNVDSSKQMELKKVDCFLGDITNAYVVVLRHLVGMGLLVQEAQLCGVELLHTIFSLSTDFDKHYGRVDFIVDISLRFICAQKDLGLSFIPELSAVIPSLFVTLIQLELEHEQLSVLKLLIILFKWKRENDAVLSREELLFIFPVINLVSSPCKSVKQAAIEVLSMLEKLLTNSLAVPKTNVPMQGRYTTISSREDIILKLLKHVWSEDQPLLVSSFLLNFASNDDCNLENMHAVPEVWTSLLKEYSMSVIGRQKSLLPISQAQLFVLEMSVLLCSVASVLIMHSKLADSAVDLLAVVGSMDPKLGVPLLLAVLFYNKMFHREYKDIDSPSMTLKLLEMLPSLASHTVMAPLVIQTILPMLQKDAKPLLYATAVRLLCKTWETNDRVFGTLQGVLHPKCFTQYESEKNICFSMAASIRDVCRKNPDRGVDLILSVSACIESQDYVVQGLGFQSLSHLCQADVIDFYTAWDVISKHVLESLGNPHAASSACLLLQWGALDAETYPEAARQVLQILWDIATTRHSDHGSMWAKARMSAFNALSYYEVPLFDKCLPNFKKRNLELITSETDPEVLKTMETFEAKIITYEHITRRRSIKEKRVPANKIEKLLDVFPRNIFASGNVFGGGQLPGAALFCLPLIPRSLTKGPQNAQGLQDVHAKYENVLVEIVSSLQLSRNILIALLSLQSLKPFMRRWIRDCTTFLDAKAPSTALEKTTKAADDILKIIRRLAEESIPRSAENIALAFGALCEVLPPSAHAVKSAASKFLLDWLFQYEHEHRQWSAAISLGVISSCLHVTDHKQKSQNIEALIEVASCSRNTLVKGACGLGLGLSCQGLLTSVEASHDSNLEGGSCKTQELNLVGKIVRILSQMICQFSPSSSDLQESISLYFPLGADVTDSLSKYESWDKNYDELEEDVWGVAGLVLGLGSSIGAVYRAGAHGVVNKIKSSVISWIPHLNDSIQNSSNKGGLDILLSVGSCLAIPMIVSFCQRVELMHDYELDHLLSGLKELISELLSIKKSGAFRQSLLMASCVGAGSLLSCILNEGVHPLEVELVKDFLALFKRSYSDSHPPLVHFGGMLGVVNALGAGAGSLAQSYSLTTRSTYDRKDSLSIIGPLLSSPSLEPQLTSLMQEMFLVAQHSDDPILKQYAAWAISTLRQHLWFKEGRIIDSSSPSGAAGKESQNFPQDSVVLELSLWLMQLNRPEAGGLSHVYTIASILGCLSRAPRLPGLDWGAIVRRCMKYESQVAEMSPELVSDKGILREECLKLCLAHANEFDPLLNVLDELSDLSRFRTLELNLQSWILLHLSDLSKKFSGSRIVKLFIDVANFLSSLQSNKAFSTEQKRLLRIASWQGLCLCMDETLPDASEYVSNMEHCMEILFSFLPLLHSAVVQRMEEVHSVEWLAAVKCLSKAHQSWLLKFLQVPDGNLVVEGGDFPEVVKKIQASARLVQRGSFPLSELAKLKAYLLDTNSDGIWGALVEIVAALQHVDASTKRQWLVDAVEISCVTTHPSTALQFVGLLCGSLSKYMPLVVMDKEAVLSDLPVTLSSLLSDTRWASVAETVVSNLWSSTQRIYVWATHGVASGGNESSSIQQQQQQQPIDPSENEKAVFLLKVVHHACLLLREYLSSEQQLMLANLVLP